MKMYIYLIRDPATNDIRYVGQTKSPKNRYKQYKSPGMALYRSNWPFYQWLLGLLYHKTPPVMDVVETTNKKSANTLEQVWIHKMVDGGYKLFNKHIMRRKELDRRIEEQQT